MDSIKDKIKKWYSWNRYRFGIRHVREWYWTVYRWFFPCNVIKVRSLPRSWTDTDGVIEAALPQLFLDFVEIEKPFDHFDTEESSHRENWQKIRYLYYWWKYIGPQMVRRRDFDYQTWQEEQICNQILTDKLCEIIQLRGHYWT